MINLLKNPGFFEPLHVEARTLNTKNQKIAEATNVRDKYKLSYIAAMAKQLQDRVPSEFHHVLQTPVRYEEKRVPLITSLIHESFDVFNMQLKTKELIVFPFSNFFPVPENDFRQKISEINKHLEPDFSLGFLLYHSQDKACFSLRF